MRSTGPCPIDFREPTASDEPPVTPTSTQSCQVSTSGRPNALTIFNNVLTTVFTVLDALFDETATLAFGSVEFPTALAQPDTPFGPVSGLFSIDIEADSISQVILPEMDDPFWSQVFNTYPAGDFDRYYLTFSEPHGVTGATSDNVSASLRIDSDTTMVVEIGEGWEQVTGNAFELTFTCAPVAELAVTGASSSLLAVMGGAAVLGGALILGQARRLHGVRA